MRQNRSKRNHLRLYYGHQWFIIDNYVLKAVFFLITILVSLLIRALQCGFSTCHLIAHALLITDFGKFRDLYVNVWIYFSWLKNKLKYHNVEFWYIFLPLGFYVKSSFVSLKSLDLQLWQFQHLWILVLVNFCILSELKCTKNYISELLKLSK